MVEANIVLTLLQTISIMVGIGYYILNIQNNQRNQEIALKNQELTLQSQKHAEETRKIQLLYEINQYMREPESNERFFNMMNMEWENYEDYTIKYSLENDPDLYNGRSNFWRMTNFSGLLVRDGLLDISTYIQFVGDNDPIIWSKFKPSIEGMRSEWDSPDLYVGMEFLAEEVDKYRVSKGLKPKAYI